MWKEGGSNPACTNEVKGTTHQRIKVSDLVAKIALTVYVGVLREACPPPELLVEMREAACVTSP